MPTKWTEIRTGPQSSACFSRALRASRLEHGFGHGHIRSTQRVGSIANSSRMKQCFGLSLSAAAAFLLVPLNCDKTSHDKNMKLKYFAQLSHVLFHCTLSCWWLLIWSWHLVAQMGANFLSFSQSQSWTKFSTLRDLAIHPMHQNAIWQVTLLLDPKFHARIGACTHLPNQSSICQPRAHILMISCISPPFHYPQFSQQRCWPHCQN